MHSILTGIWYEFLSLRAMVRRDFIRQVARGGILAGMAALAGVLVARNQVTLREDCTDNFRCRSCSRLSGCTLPEATLTRKEDGKG
jgi:hypothetical protein